MKKTSLFLAAALLLAGCSSKTSDTTSLATKVTDGNNAVVTVSGIKLTKQDIFEKMLSSFGADKTLNSALQVIAEAELDDTSSVDSAVEDTLALYEAYLGSRDNVEDYIKDSGYESLEQYKNDVLIPNELQTLLMKKYIEENYDTLIADYGFTYIRYFTVELESDALTYISAIDNGEKTFEQAAEEAFVPAKEGEEFSTPATTLISTVYSGSDVDSTLITMAASFTVEGMYSVPITLSDSSYAVVQIVSKDMSEVTDKVESQLLNNDAFVIKAEAYYLQKHNFAVYESSLKDSITAISEDYFKTEAE